MERTKQVKSIATDHKAHLMDLATFKLVLQMQNENHDKFTDHKRDVEQKQAFKNA